MKRYVVIFGLVGVVAVLVTGAVMRGRFVELWQLEKLESEDAAERESAIARLVELESVQAVSRILGIISATTTFESLVVLRPVAGKTLAFETVPPGADGSYSLTFGVDIACYENEMLCRGLIELVAKLRGRAVAPLLAALASDDLHTRYLAVAMLGALGQDAREAFPFIRRIVFDLEADAALTPGRPSFRIEASETLVKLVHADDEQLIDAFLEMIRHWDQPLRVAGFKGLIAVGARAVPALVEAIRRGESDARLSAIEACAHMRDAASGAVLAIVEALENGETEVRTMAIQALFQMGSVASGAAPTLAKLATDESQDELIRSIARQAYESVSESASPAPAPGGFRKPPIPLPIPEHRG